jgi:hypothetical protein
VGIDYHSELFGGSYAVFMRDIDPLTLKLGPEEEVSGDSFGPVNTSDSDYSLLSDSAAPSWPLLGFDPIVVTGGLQLKH